MYRDVGYYQKELFIRVGYLVLRNLFRLSDYF